MANDTALAPLADQFVAPLRAGQVFRRCDPMSLPFKTVNELEELPVPPGQEVAIEALRFGVSIGHPDYHLYTFAASAETHGFVRDYLEGRAATEPLPADICYVNNFDNPQRPNALSLPAGRGAQLRDAMKNLVQELRATLPATFESEDYRARHHSIDEKFKEKHEKAFDPVQQRARREGVAIIRTPMGIAFAPMRGGSVLAPQEFERLPRVERDRVTATIESLQKELEQVLRQIPVWGREHRDEVRKLNRDVTGYAVGHLIDELRQKYSDLPAVAMFLAAVERDVLEHADDFLDQQGARGDGSLAPTGDHPDDFAFRRYGVNLLVDSSARTGAPVVYEDNPTVHSLVGRIEHIARFGALLTDFNLLRAGALHRANGGYLMLDAIKMLRNPLAYDALKRALRAREIRIQSLEQMLSLTGTVAPEAEPVRLNIKVVLTGPRWLYYALCEIDPEFAELFKVQVDVEDRIDRSPESALGLARLIAGLVHRHRLKPFDRAAVARIIEHAARLSGDSAKLAVETPPLLDLLKESDHWAQQAKREIVGAADVQLALDAAKRRADRLYRRLREQVHDGVLRVETTGARVGQVNGLSVAMLGNFSFGFPSRITAQVRLGGGRVIDIEREVKLGGRIHSKGVLILSGFLGGRYAQESPLALHASLVFEQSYGQIEGDSASAAELFALLSAIGQIPARQDLAVTGSVDQHGQIQAIGGVNEKIEGYFDICQERGLTGRQGVVIPASNVRHLMLRQDVVDAIGAGTFAVYAIDTVDQGLALLTGLPAGDRNAEGIYPAGTANGMVAARLGIYARKAIELARHAEGAADGEQK